MQTFKQVIEKNQPQIFSLNPAKNPASASTLKTNPKQETTSSTSIQQEAYDKRVDTLFLRFNAIYGALWLSAYNNEKALEAAKLEWADSIKEFDSQVLTFAVEKIKRTQQRPPVIPVFVELCISIQKSIKAREEALRAKPENHKRTDPQIVKSHIKEMMEKLTSPSVKEKKSC